MPAIPTALLVGAALLLAACSSAPPCSSCCAQAQQRNQSGCMTRVGLCEGHDDETAVSNCLDGMATELDATGDNAAASCLRTCTSD